MTADLEAAQRRWVEALPPMRAGYRPAGGRKDRETTVRAEPPTSYGWRRCWWRAVEGNWRWALLVSVPPARPTTYLHPDCPRGYLWLLPEEAPCPPT